jgi:hypothetical protein
MPAVTEIGREVVGAGEPHPGAKKISAVSGVADVLAMQRRQ